MMPNFGPASHPHQAHVPKGGRMNPASYPNMPRVFAQPERHRRANAIFEYSTAPNQKTAQNCSQVPYKAMCGRCVR